MDGIRPEVASKTLTFTKSYRIFNKKCTRFYGREVEGKTVENIGLI